MLSLGAPGFLYAAVVAALGVVALHFLAWRRPKPVMLPTARFVDATPLRAVSRDVRLADVALLVVRVLATLLFGLALASPRVAPVRSGEALLFVADRSRAVASMDEMRDSLASIARTGGVQRIVWFDSAPASPADFAADPASIEARTERRGNLDAALVAATREGSRLARTHERVRVVVVSPVVREEVGAGIDVVRETWSDTIRFVRVTARHVADSGAALVQGSMPPVEDAVGAVMRLALGSRRVATSVAAVRGALTSADSAFTREGGVTLVWPATRPAQDSAVRVFSVTTPQRTFVGDFVRGATPARGRAIAWGADGEILAREEAMGRGCLRSLAFAPNERGDVALRAGFVAIVGDLLGACGDVDWRPASATTIARLTNPIAPSRSPASADAGDSSAPNARRWLLIVVLMLLGAEWWMRRTRQSRAATSATHARTAANEAAA
jgi:hypothetical protein